MASMENICNVVHEMRPLLLMIFGQIILAGMNIVFKLATSDGMNFSILIFYRCLFASVFMVPLALILHCKVQSLILKFSSELNFFFLIFFQ